VLQQGLQQVRQPTGVGVREEREGGEDDVDDLGVAVASHFFEEEDGVLGRVGEGGGAQDLAGGEGGDVEVVC